MIFANLLQSAINRYFQLDPESLTNCAALENKVIGIKLQRSPIRFYLQFTPDPQQHYKILVLNHHEKPDATITGTPIAFIKSRLPTADPTSKAPAGINIEGDIHVAKAFNEVLDDLDIDWEEQLAKFTGDTVAHGLSKLLRGGLKWGKSTCQSVQENITEFMQEEARCIPPRAEVEDFITDIQTLVADTDRIAARVQRLKQHLENS